MLSLARRMNWSLLGSVDSDGEKILYLLLLCATDKRPFSVMATTVEYNGDHFELGPIMQHRAEMPSLFLRNILELKDGAYIERCRHYLSLSLEFFTNLIKLSGFGKLPIFINIRSFSKLSECVTILLLEGYPSG